MGHAKANATKVHERAAGPAWLSARRIAEAKRLEAIAKAKAAAMAKRRGPGYIAGPFGFGVKYYNDGSGNGKFRFAKNKPKYSKLRPAWNKARRQNAADSTRDCTRELKQAN